MVGSPGSNAAIARALMHEVGTGSLATLGADGAPFASYVVTAPAGDGSPILLLSDLAGTARTLRVTPAHRCFLSARLCPARNRRRTGSR